MARGAGGAVGFVVAGGESRRMGKDKALLPWGEGTLLDHAVARLHEICRAVRILSGPRHRYGHLGLPIDVDVLSDAGALGAICTGLLHVPDDRDAGVFLAVDLPHVPAALLRALAARGEGHDAAVPVTARGPEPLCALYRRSCLRPIVRRLALGDYKMTSFWPDVRVREVGEEELSAFGDPARVFHNINTPEQYESARGPGEVSRS